jgi:hypothetical protein
MEQVAKRWDKKARYLLEKATLARLLFRKFRKGSSSTMQRKQIDAS